MALRIKIFYMVDLRINLCDEKWRNALFTLIHTLHTFPSYSFGWTIRDSNPGGYKRYFLHNVQTDPGTHLGSCQQVPGFFLWLKHPRREVELSPSRGSEVMSEQSLSPIPRRIPGIGRHLTSALGFIFTEF